MIRFEAEIKKFGQQGEKTGWTYIGIPGALAGQLLPGNRKSFRVKGKIDRVAISGIALMPMGDGDFIMPLNAALRRQLGKGKGASVQLQLAVDHEEPKPPQELIECLRDEPAALEQFNSLPRSQRNYFIKWILSAKSEATIARRIAQTVTAMAAGRDFPTMLRAMKKFREEGLL
jgi:hypothetical protein